MSVIKKGKEKLMKIAEIVHLKFFGHPMSGAMREFLGILTRVLLLDVLTLNKYSV